MAKRMTFMLATMALLVSALGFVKFRQIQMGMAQAASFQPPPEAVTTIVAKSEEWPTTLAGIGTVAAVHGVTVSADLPGIVETITFDSGHVVQKGDMLVQLDAKQERAQLAAAESQRDLAKLDLDSMADLYRQGITAQADHDRLKAQYTQAEARVGEIRATIERKQIRAPFTGLLGIRKVNLGQYLNAGDAIVPLQSLDPVYVNFAVPQQEAAPLKAGVPVDVTADDLKTAEVTGTITALDSVVDPGTRNVQVQATFPNPTGALRPGMFVQAHVHLGRSAPITALPASAINYAPYGDSVWVVSQLDGPHGRYRGVTQHFVKLGGGRGDQVAVLSGVKEGDEVVTSGVFKLRPNAAVAVHNDVQPANDPAPKPEDN